MDALIIGPQHGLASAFTRMLRRQGRAVLQAIPADAADGERAAWLLDEAGDPPLVVVIDAAPYGLAHELMALTRAQVVLVAEHRVASARPGVRPARTYTPRDAAGLTVVPLGRAGHRWIELDGGRRQPMGAERAAALVLRSCGVEAASCR